jgi:multicomponent K+:H+ antiporter subunit A
VHVASALFFDIGVYAVVVGSTLLILTALAHQSVRSHRPTSLPLPIDPAPSPTSQGAL